MPCMDPCDYSVWFNAGGVLLEVGGLLIVISMTGNVSRSVSASNVLPHPGRPSLRPE